MNQRIGRFEILRLLGKGAQSAVYLAFDPHLEREVAIKTLHFARPDEAQNRRLLQEARTVSKLRHANVVPIFEAGEQDGDPYLVFEYVEGRTVAELLREEGALAPPRAVELMIQVLDAVAYAHRFGTVHRDLKPSNILIDGAGLARVMDFGIAAPQSHGGDGLMGTPAYMAPEYIAERIVGPQSDIFAAGLVLYEMLMGRRAVAVQDAAQAMRQIVDVDIALPEQGAEHVDIPLRDVITKATARDLHVRYGSAQQMKNFLEEYLKPADEAAPDEEREGAPSTLDFLLRRMRHNSDFPALSESISSVNRLASSDRENISTLSNTILKDFALTNKILRLVNSAHFRSTGGGHISTVSRAIVVLGFDTIRNIAVSLILFDHLQNKSNASDLKEEFLRANLGGMLAKNLSAKLLCDSEEVFICAMFHNLGRMLASYYFPEETEEIKRQMQQTDTSEEKAAVRVLGITYEELGTGIARHWGFPEPIIHAMRPLPAGTVRAPATREDRLRVVAIFSDEICQAIERSKPEDREREIEKVRGRFGEAVAITEGQLHGTVEKSIDEMAEFSHVIHVNLRQTRFGRNLLQSSSAPQKAVAAAAVDRADWSVEGAALGARPAAAAEGQARDATAADDALMGTPDAQTILASGIQDISNSLVDDFSLNDVLRIILETMYRALGFKRVLLCVRDARSNTMVGRLGFGPGAEDVARRFRFALGGVADLFNVVLGKGVDVLVHDAAEEKIVGRIPDWYRKAAGAPTFILLPLLIRGAPVALIYADKDKAGEIVISEKELSLLRTLRNQAVLAIKQSS